MKINPSRNGEITLSFTDVGKSWTSSDSNVTNKSFNAIRENKKISKISEFTVLTLLNGKRRHARICISCWNLLDLILNVEGHVCSKTYSDATYGFDQLYHEN